MSVPDSVAIPNVVYANNFRTYHGQIVRIKMTSPFGRMPRVCSHYTSFGLLAEHEHEVVAPRVVLRRHGRPVAAAGRRSSNHRDARPFLD